MESLDQIWRDYNKGLLGFIRRRVGGADLAEDVLQDVFVKAHEGSGRAAKSFAAWRKIACPAGTGEAQKRFSGLLSYQV